VLVIVAAGHMNRDIKVHKDENQIIFLWKRKEKKSPTLNREPIEENFDLLDDSSGEGTNKPDTKGHLEAYRSAWCSATT